MADHLGSTRMMTDSAGNQQALYDYAPYGEELTTQGSRDARWGDSGVGLRFTGKQQEGSEGDYMYDFGARFYSPGMGRFTSPDPIWVEVGRLVDPQGLNLYAYGQNNPLKFTDPTGTDVVLGNCPSDMTISMCQAAATAGLSKDDRPHSHWVRGDGSNGFKKGQWGLTVDPDYKSSSPNFTNLSKAANDHSNTLELDFVPPHAPIPVLVGVVQGGRTILQSFKDYYAAQVGGKGVDMYLSAADQAFGLTLYPLIGAPIKDSTYTASKNTQMYIASDASATERTATFFHELVHVVLGDFGKAIPQGGHGYGTVDAQTRAAEAEARKNSGN